VVSVGSLQVSETWLESTGRTATCTSPIIEPNPGSPPDIYRANIGCYTPGTTPLGAQGGGLIASFVLTPGGTPSSSPLTLNNAATFLIDTTAQSAYIPAIKRNASVVVAECADFNGDNVVSASDIGLMIGHFGTSGGPPPSPNWDAQYDMNLDNAVAAGDIGIVVAQFGRLCPS
jgi:hypothetical protein